MSDQLTAMIPLEQIRSLQIYLNSPRKTLRQIKTATGADYILNGTLYNLATGAVNCHLKKDGQVLANPPYAVYGYEWDKGADIAMGLLPSEKDNYMACTPLIISGSKIKKLTYDAGQGGKRGRSAIGLKDGALVLYCAKDGGKAAATPEQLRDKLFADGWESAVMLDGGGSSQCDFIGSRITSGRNVQHLLLVYLHAAACPYPQPGRNVRYGTIGTGAKWVQWMLNHAGAGLAVDGVFGRKSVAALKAFQVKNDLAADGICGVKTREKLLKQ